MPGIQIELDQTTYDAFKLVAAHNNRTMKGQLTHLAINDIKECRDEKVIDDFKPTIFGKENSVS